jgi:cytochrome c-type biogenesis protein CcmF
MIAEIGHFALTLALLLAIAQGTVPLAGAARGRADLMALARWTANGQFLFILVAFVALGHAFVVSDFSVALVAQNSHTQKPLLYKLSGVWGNHEGSMVLWVLMLAAYGLAVAEFGHNLPASLRARVLAVQGMVGAGFLAFIVFASNPFTRLDPAPLEGRGLNPLLQDPGLAFHPPFLYLGYVGFSMAFSFAIAALIEGRVDAAWARWVRPWTLAAWSALTIGIALGSWWAYYELGWGGFWFWDPVENASFLPWLVGTALLHSAIVVERRDTLKSWTILLAILAFTLSLLGTFLVRSGVLTSVHAFASDPERGVFILALMVAVVGGGLTLYAMRAPKLAAGGLFAPVSREGALVLNNLLLVTGAAVVLLGTLYPLLLDAVGGGKVSVGPPFFNATFVPLMVPLLIACGVGAMLSWKRADLAGVASRMTGVALVTAVVMIATAYFAVGARALAALGLGLAAWLVAGAGAALVERAGLGRTARSEGLRRLANLPRAVYGMTLAHAGVGILVAGVAASTLWQTERIVQMRAGDTLEIAGYTIAFDGAREVAGPNYVAIQGVFRVLDGTETRFTLTPERRSYPAERSQTTEAAIHTTWFADLYVVLGEGDGANRWTVRAYHNPLVPWIWVGAIVMALGGMVSLTDRRLRVGAPKRAAGRQGADLSGAAAAGE